MSIVMAIPHFDFHGISKSDGSNIIATSSYQARRSMVDELETDSSKKRKKSFSTTKDHRLTLMMLPSGAPAEYNDPERCWNDLNKIEKDRLGVRFLLPLPKELTEAQAIELAKIWAYQEFVSKGLVVQLSFHAERNKNGNFHCHGLASYRQLINGTWADIKSKKLYLDENDNVLEKVDTPKLKNKKLQYDKNGNIKMTKGWQRLVYDDNGNPLLNADGTPVLKDIRVPELDENGEQKKSKNGKYEKLRWKERKMQFTDLERQTASHDARMLWQSVQNKFFKEHNILDENGQLLQVDLRSYAEQDKNKPDAEKRIPTRHHGIGPQAEEIKMLNAMEMQRRKDVASLSNIQNEIAKNEKIIQDYMEQQQGNIENSFVNYYATPYDNAIKYVHNMCDNFLLIAKNNCANVEHEIKKNEKNKIPSDRRDAQIELLRAYGNSWGKTISTIQKIRNTKYDNGIRQHYRSMWKKLNGWHRCKFISEHISKKMGAIYHAYLKDTTDSPTDSPTNLPPVVSMETAINSLIRGKSMPTLKQKFVDNPASTINGIASDLMVKWNKTAPPSTTDFEFFSLLNNIPNRISQIITKQPLTYKTVTPPDYHPELDYQKYQQSIKRAEILEKIAILAYHDETGRDAKPTEEELQNIIAELRKHPKNLNRLANKYGIENTYGAESSNQEAKTTPNTKRLDNEHLR